MKTTISTGLVKSVILLAATAFCAGCASGPTVKERFYWPRLPETPRVEWLGAYMGESDLAGASAFGSLLKSEQPLDLRHPVGIAADGDGKVYVADTDLGLVVFDLVAKRAYKGLDDVTERPTDPTGIALDRDGRIYVADSKERKIYIYDRNLHFARSLELGKHGLVSIGYLAVDSERKRLVVPDIRGHRVVIVDMDGALVTSFGSKGTDDGSFLFPVAVALSKEGNILVADQMNARVQVFSPDGKFLSKFGERGDDYGALAIIKGLTVDSEGHVFVTDGRNHKIGIYDVQGRFYMDMGSRYAYDGRRVMPGGFNTPLAIYVDKNDTIYVADSMNHRFQIFQYLNEAYLKLHPLTEGEPAKELTEEDKPKKKK